MPASPCKLCLHRLLYYVKRCKYTNIFSIKQEFKNKITFYVEKHVSEWGKLEVLFTFVQYLIMT